MYKPQWAWYDSHMMTTTRTTFRAHLAQYGEIVHHIDFEADPYDSDERLLELIDGLRDEAYLVPLDVLLVEDTRDGAIAIDNRDNAW